MDKRKIQGLVANTGWNEFIELNRVAFSDNLPRNSESRALAVAVRLLRQHYSQIKWVISFADATQCGDGTIYRAAGFVLTGIKKNNQIWEALSGPRESRTSLTDNSSHGQQQAARRFCHVTMTKGKNITGIHSLSCGGASMKAYIEAGFKPLEGFQLRYIYFLDPVWRPRLTVPEIPFSMIAEVGATMYKGQRCARSIDNDATASQADEGGVIPTLALQNDSRFMTNDPPPT